MWLLEDHGGPNNTTLHIYKYITLIRLKKKQYVMLQVMIENKNDGMKHYETNTNIILRYISKYCIKISS